MKTKMKYLLVGLVGLIVISGLILWSYNYVKEKNSINIVFFDKQVEKYSNMAADSPNDKDDLLNQYIQKDFDVLVKKVVPIEGQEMARSCFFRDYFNSPASLKLYLDSSKNEGIAQVLKTSYEKSKKISGSTEKVTVNIVVVPISGVTYGITGTGNFIVLYVNCLDTNDKLFKEVEEIFIHEYAHTLSLDYAEKNGGTLNVYPDTFLAHTILEGKACVFANLISSNELDNKLIPKKPINNIEFYHDILNKKFTETAYSYYAVDDKTFTRDDCYYYGIKMVEKYIEIHKDIQPEQWLYLTPEEIYNDVKDVVQW